MAGPAGLLLPPGNIFITPAGEVEGYAYGPEILDLDGDVVWFHPVPQDQQAGQTSRPSVA